MNIPFHLLEYLKTNSKVTLSGFGDFYLKKIGASIQDDGRILPPSSEIALNWNPEARNSDFITYLATKEAVSNFDAELEVKKVTTNWNSTLESLQDLSIEPIGSFVKDDRSMIFYGARISDQTPDYYGLEEITLSSIHSVREESSASEDTDAPNDYKFNRSILWLFLILIPIGGLIYGAIEYQELLFGKKSPKDVEIKTSTKRIEKPVAIVDSTQLKPVDSLKMDSLITTTIVPAIKGK